MTKKGKKTKADEKEDAFERLYAILAAGTPGLPPLEKSPMPSAAPIKSAPTQEDKEKEQAEFDKLYAQLAALSSRKKEVVPTPMALEVPVATPVAMPVAMPTPVAMPVATPTPVSTLEAIPVATPVSTPVAVPVSTLEAAPVATPTPVPVTVEQVTPVAQEEQNEFNEIYAQIVRIIAVKTKLEPQVLLPAPKPKIEPKHNLQCQACLKTLCNLSSFIRHKRISEACKTWYALPEDQKPPLISMPIHEMVGELLERAITGDKPLTCKFCSTTFYNRGNHHKHYQSAHTCNRMAYAEFKRITAL